MFNEFKRVGLVYIQLLVWIKVVICLDSALSSFERKFKMSLVKIKPLKCLNLN